MDTMYVSTFSEVRKYRLDHFGKWRWNDTLSFSLNRAWGLTGNVVAQVVTLYVVLYPYLVVSVVDDGNTLFNMLQPTSIVKDLRLTNVSIRGIAFSPVALTKVFTLKVLSGLTACVIVYCLVQLPTTSSKVFSILLPPPPPRPPPPVF